MEGHLHTRKSADTQLMPAPLTAGISSEMFRYAKREIFRRERNVKFALRASEMFRHGRNVMVEICQKANFNFIVFLRY